MEEEDSPGRARSYRKRAQELRQMASEAHSTEARDIFLRLAEGHERMAKRLEQPGPQK